MQKNSLFSNVASWILAILLNGTPSSRHKTTIQQMNCYTRWNQLCFYTMVFPKHSSFVAFPEVFFSSF